MEIPASGLWDDVLSVLHTEMDEDSFATWLNPTTQVSCENSTLVIGVPNAISRNWLSSHYKNRITEVAQRLLCRPIEILFEVQESLEIQRTMPMEVAREEDRSSRLNDQYTFNTFVVGESNRFAHAAAQAVADMHNEGYNPLFVYGGVGLGKTHLMHAIGHQIVKFHPKTSVLYVSAEQFMNSFIDSVKQSKALEFRNFYRNADLLLIDDVQFFIGKEATQAEFFHTFNALYNAGKRIVVSSDKPPKELNHLDERLKNRFEWGLIVDIQPPDLETRVAILQSKAEIHDVKLPYNHALFIAERIKTNVRKLEGVIKQLKARQAFGNGKFSGDELNKFITPFLAGEEVKRISPELACHVVCEFFNVELEELKGKSRIRKQVTARHVAMYLCRQVARLSFPEIGLYFGSRDHTSVMHGCRKIEDKIKADSNTQNLVTFLTRKLLDAAS